MSDASVTGDGGASRKEVVTDAQGLSYMPELHGYPTPAEVVASIEKVPGGPDTEWKLSVSPGSVALRVRRTSHATATRDTSRSPDAPRRRIVEFSAKSELRMLKRFVSLDYTPWVLDMRRGRMLAMVTLTLPGGDWSQFAPDAKTLKLRLRALRARLERATGPAHALVKLVESQKRGAPHVHFLLPLPATVVDRRTQTATPITTWMSTAWFEIVGSDDERHLRAGTGVDWSTGARAIDPVRVARYFAKYSAKGSTHYQNAVPRLWLENGGSGRFWSVWRLKPVEETVSISYEDFIEVRRVLRRLDRSKQRTRKVQVRRVKRRTGQVYTRSVNRRRPNRSLQSGRIVGGTQFAESGPALMTELGRFLEVLANQRKTNIGEMT